jgi:hypothetical protein
MRSMVEGASQSPLRCRRGRIAAVRAPSPAQMRGPLPHFRGNYILDKYERPVYSLNQELRG